MCNSQWWEPYFGARALLPDAWLFCRRRRPGKTPTPGSFDPGGSRAPGGPFLAPMTQFFCVFWRPLLDSLLPPSISRPFCPLCTAGWVRPRPPARPDPGGDSWRLWEKTRKSFPAHPYVFLELDTRRGHRKFEKSPLFGQFSSHLHPRPSLYISLCAVSPSQVDPARLSVFAGLVHSVK